ncbi:MAG: thiamine phosphate synthase [Bacteroidota bacterium]|nr:thiamine phosphate synthase [Bacteroidota bacterium]
MNSKIYISHFHYLTQDLPDISHQQLAQIACENGIRWIQLRVKNKPYDEWLQISKDVKIICDRFQTILIINDNIEIAKEIDAHGVHLGKEDKSIKEARKILGSEKIIGGTANSAADILKLQDDGADYVGLGPFRFTSTKENLSMIIGLDGYSPILQSSNSSIPIIAIGGITIEDVKPLMNTGVYGIAVSSAINLADNKEEAIHEFLGNVIFHS